MTGLIAENFESGVDGADVLAGVSRFDACSNVVYTASVAGEGVLSATAKPNLTGSLVTGLLPAGILARPAAVEYTWLSLCTGTAVIPGFQVAMGYYYEPDPMWSDPAEDPAGTAWLSDYGYSLNSTENYIVNTIPGGVVNPAPPLPRDRWLRNRLLVDGVNHQIRLRISDDRTTWIDHSVTPASWAQPSILALRLFNRSDGQSWVDDFRVVDRSANGSAGQFAPRFASRRI